MRPSLSESGVYTRGEALHSLTQNPKNSRNGPRIDRTHLLCSEITDMLSDNSSRHSDHSLILAARGALICTSTWKTRPSHFAAHEVQVPRDVESHAHDLIVRHLARAALARRIRRAVAPRPPRRGWRDGGRGQGLGVRVGAAAVGHTAPAKTRPPFRVRKQPRVQCSEPISMRVQTSGRRRAAPCRPRSAPPASSLAARRCLHARARTHARARRSAPRRGR